MIFLNAKCAQKAEKSSLSIIDIDVSIQLLYFQLIESIVLSVFSSLRFMNKPDIVPQNLEIRES